MIYGMQTVRAITITGGGEPTENPELLNISAEINMYQKRLGLFTNMEHPERIQPKHYDWIRVSVTTKSLDKSGYDWISSCPKVGFCVNYSGMKDAHLVEKAIELLEKHDFSYIHVRPLLGRDGASLPVDLSGIPKHDKVIVKIEKATDIIAGERLYGDCVGHNFVPFIWEDGSVYTCAYHRGNPTYLLGNAITGNFGAIMTTAAKTYPVIPSCMVCCKNHDANTLIHLCNLVENPEFI
jgi:MoaA/NifB/PqqE/SkfB family radical SAM enzyme